VHTSDAFIQPLIDRFGALESSRSISSQDLRDFIVEDEGAEDDTFQPLSLPSAHKCRSSSFLDLLDAEISSSPSVIDALDEPPSSTRFQRKKKKRKRLGGVNLLQRTFSPLEKQTSKSRNPQPGRTKRLEQKQLQSQVDDEAIKVEEEVDSEHNRFPVAVLHFRPEGDVFSIRVPPTDKRQVVSSTHPSVLSRIPPTPFPRLRTDSPTHVFFFHADSFRLTSAS